MGARMTSPATSSDSDPRRAPGTSWRSRLAPWWPFAAVVIGYLVVATQQIDLPGVYMDAVNPDYLVVRLLNANAEPITAWLLPGNYLKEKAPVLISFYHGSEQVWLGLPFFWLFGTTVTGLRLTHAMFALGLLGALYALLATSGMRPWQAGLACLALAIDPAFSYAFRTQSYITLAPTAWLALSLFALQRVAARPSRRYRWLALSGAAYGFSVVGYFIYAFFLPALLVAVALWSADAKRATRLPAARRAWPTWSLWIAAAAVGGACYPVGYALTVVQFGGFAAAWAYFQQTQQALQAFAGQPQFSERLAHVVEMVEAVVQNWAHHMLIFGEYTPLPGSGVKTALLAGGPVALWVCAEIRHRVGTLLRVLLTLIASFLVVSLIFGARLQGHHFVPLLPLAYAALAVALRDATPDLRRYAPAIFVVPLLFLAGLNVVGQFREAGRLAETRGVGLYSDAIDRLAEDLNAMPRKPFVYFPDWGLSMPVAFLTGGTVGMDSVEDFAGARRMLCAGRDVAVAFVNGDRSARIASWRESLRWDAPTTVVYRQGNGSILFELARFQGKRDAPSCESPPGSAPAAR